MAHATTQEETSMQGSAVILKVVPCPTLLLVLVAGNGLAAVTEQAKIRLDS